MLMYSLYADIVNRASEFFCIPSFQQFQLINSVNYYHSHYFVAMQYKMEQVHKTNLIFLVKLRCYTIMLSLLLEKPLSQFLREKF